MKTTKFVSHIVKKAPGDRRLFCPTYKRLD
jgi:hypothetical protein